MQITEVKVFPVKKFDERIKAFATIAIDDCFLVRDLKVINGNSGLFIAMPSRKRPDGTYADVAHPLNSETRALIEDVVLAEYHRVIREGGVDGANGNGRQRSADPDGLDYDQGHEVAYGTR